MWMDLFRNPWIRSFLLALYDLGVTTLAYVLAFWLRLDALEPGQTMANYWPTIAATLPWLMGIRFVCGLLVRQYLWSFHHASLAEAMQLALGCAAGSVLFVAYAYWGTSLDVPPVPRSVPLMEFAVTLMGMGALRFGPRYLHALLFERGVLLAPNGESHLRTLIYGAGHSGELILRDIQRTRIYPYQIVGFIDDSPTKIGTSIHGKRVLGDFHDLPGIITKHSVDKILIAAPISASRLREVVDLCANHHLRLKKVPNLADVVAGGDAAPMALKDVQLEDLLEREAVRFDHSRMAEFLLGKTILVTGAAGSIGAELCRQIAHEGAERLVAVDLNENDLYMLNLELQELAPRLRVHLEIATVRDAERLEHLFARYKPALVFHAAAHKHVPLMEACGSEALKNNVLGTLNVARAADRHGAERMVLISTDKAVRPSNVMGASKHLAERIVRRLNAHSETRFMAVRFGNVLGSNGSLVPILRRQIEKGGPVTITHPKITRFFMTIPEAVGLVLVAAASDAGTVCVLDMGVQLSVDALARQMISLAGLIPETDIEIVYTGLRPGEKMYEELFLDEEELHPSDHPRIRVAKERQDDIDLDAMTEALHAAATAEYGGDTQAVRAFLSRYVPGYDPEGKGEAATQVSGDSASTPEC